MARIVYKEGLEGQNKLFSIEGIEIDLFNGQKALVFPCYAEKVMVPRECMKKYTVNDVPEIEALKVTDAGPRCKELRNAGSPAAEYVNRFTSDKYGAYCLPSLVAALEIRYRWKEIDALAESVEGADLLQAFTTNIWSCSRFSEACFWIAGGLSHASYQALMEFPCLAVPTILY